MHLVTTLARRSLLKRPGRTFFAIMGIAMGIAVVVAIFTLDHNTIVGLSQPGEPQWKADIRVSPSSRQKDSRKALEEMEGIEGISAFFQNDVQILEPNPDKPGRLIRHRALLFALEADQSQLFEFYTIDEGHDLRSEDHLKSALIGRGLADELGLKVGDTLRLARPPRAPRRLCVDGKMTTVKEEKPLPHRERTFRVAGILAREKLGRKGAGRVVILDYHAADDLYSDVGTRRDFLLKRRRGIDIEKLQNSLSKTWSFELNQDVIIGQAADERAFRNGVRFAGLMALGLGLYVIFHVLSIAMVERGREIATLSALGASRRQIARIFFTEALVLSGGGAVLGLGLGLVICRILLKLRITTLGAGRHIRGFEIPWEQILPLVALGAVLALLGSIYPLMRMRSSAISRAIRGEREMEQREGSRGFRIFSALLLAFALPFFYFRIVPVVGEQEPALMSAMLLAVSFFALLIGLPWVAPRILSGLGSWLLGGFKRIWPLSSVIVRRNIAEKPLRLAVSVIVIAMVTAAFVALKGMTNSLSAETEEWAAEAVDHKVFIMDMKRLPNQKLAEVLNRVDGVIAMEPGDVRAYVPFLLTGVMGEELDGFGPLQDDRMRRRFLEEPTLIVSSRLAQDLDYKVGDKVPLRTGAGVVKDYTVLAISDAYGFQPYPDERIYAVTSAARMHREFCVNIKSSTRVAVCLDEAADPDRTLTRIRRAMVENFPEASSWTYRTGLRVRHDALADIARDFFLFDIIIGLTALLGAMGILNGQLLSALERNRELGVLKALGTSRRQMAGLVLLESLVVGLLGGLLGTVLGSLLIPLVVEALQSISALTLPLRSAGMWIPLALAGALILPLLAALYPIFKINSMSVTRAIRQG